MQVHFIRRGLTAVLLLAMTGAVLSAGAASAATEPNGEVIRRWNDVAFDTVRKTAGSDAAAARLYAMVDAAMYDAVNGLQSHPRPHALVPTAHSRAGDPTAAAATAAHDVLVALYPARAVGYDAQLAQDLATVHAPGQAKHGKAWGSEVAAAVVASRSDDGSTGVETQPAGAGQGEFRTPWDAHYRRLAPFVISDPAVYVGPPTPGLDTAEYAESFKDVKLVGSTRPILWRRRRSSSGS